MVPEAFPSPRFLVYFTGILEVLGAVGLLIPVTRSLAGLGLVLCWWRCSWLTSPRRGKGCSCVESCPPRCGLGADAALIRRDDVVVGVIVVERFGRKDQEVKMSDSAAVYEIDASLGGELLDEWMARYE